LLWYALGTCKAGGARKPVLVLERGVFALEALVRGRPANALASAAAGSMDAIISDWNSLEPAMDALAEEIHAAGAAIEPLGAGVDLVEPIIPNRIFAAASNYIEHADEMGTVLAAKTQSEPYVFIKASSSVIGPEAPIVLPRSAKKIDWEVELAAVIGRGGRDIPISAALDHVMGYTILNDVSARDLTHRSDYPFKFDWFRGKSFDTFGPLGPWIVPSRIVGDPQKLALRLAVNEQVMQDGSTGAMIFSVAEQIAYLSSILTLAPGDVIATGTPDGVGLGRGTFLKPGDVVAASVERIGTLRNPVIASQASARTAERSAS
jgi:2,4-diketo-3-deoxy-L-fuconate hydrolase